MISFGGGQTDYIHENLTLSNFYVYGYRTSRITTVFIEMAVGDNALIKNFIFEDMNMNRMFFQIISGGDMIFENIEFINSEGQSQETIMAFNVNRLEIRNLTYRNYTASSNPIRPMISTSNNADVYTEISGIRIENCALLKTSLFKNLKATDDVIIKDLSFSNVSISSGESIFVLENVKHTQLSNFTFDKVTNSDTVNDGSAIISISSFLLDSGFETEDISVSLNFLGVLSLTSL